MKVLIVRFSSIGDVVLTTPVVRALKQQLPNIEIHYLTKNAFKSILQFNPYIDKIHTINQSISEKLTELKAEKFDSIIDLHKNARTLSLKLKLNVKTLSFPKLNFEKWLLVQFKKNSMPNLHVVDRYFKAVEKLGVKNDSLPCDFFIQDTDDVTIAEHFSFEAKKYVTIAIGAQFSTKRMPFNKLVELIEKIDLPIILIGGPGDVDLANLLLKAFPAKSLQSSCGNFNLSQSASIVKQSSLLITNDTGMMHIASCFQLPTISIWGSTVPELGMYPYFPKNESAFSIHQVNDLNCRPCSKIGFQECPKKHFNCMQLQDIDAIATEVEKRFEQFKKN